MFQQGALDSINMDLLPIQFTFSTFTVWAIDSLKRSPWFPWINRETSKLNMLAGVVGAAVTAAGIHFVMERDPTAGAFVIRITGLTADGIWHFIKGFGLSLASQQTILKVYQITNVLRDIAASAVQAKKENG